MKKIKILFVCTYHGARSRIAEELTKQLAPGKIEADSSCFESGVIGQIPISVLQEIGIDLPSESPKPVFKRYNDGDVYDYVITLCYKATTEQCPIFMTNIDTLYAKKAKRISWSIPDFGSLSGTKEEKIAEARKIRDTIRSKLVLFLSQIGIDVN